VYFPLGGMYIDIEVFWWYPEVDVVMNDSTVVVEVEVVVMGDIDSGDDSYSNCCSSHSNSIYGDR